jgi:GGDEF domain-containing protein
MDVTPIEAAPTIHPSQAEKAWKATQTLLPQLLPDGKSFGTDRDNINIDAKSITSRAEDLKFRELLADAFVKKFQSHAQSAGTWSNKATDTLSHPPTNISAFDLDAGHRITEAAVKEALELAVAQYDAYHARENDFLTGLLARREFMKYYEVFLGNALRASLSKTMESTELHQRHNPTPQPQYIALVMLDVDHFKDINDKFGHDIGDLALQHIGSNLQTRPGELSARFGGDEFVLFLPD